MRTLVLCGHQGCGKTTVGRWLAQRLSLPFIDIDLLMEQQAGIGYRELWKRGERLYRCLERQVIAQLLLSGPSVVATGGASPLDPTNARKLQGLGPLIFLEVPFAGQREYYRRLPLYRLLADHTVDGKDPLLLDQLAALALQ